MTDKRNSDGTFAKGNAGGPGRPPRATESEYLRVMMGACSLDTFREVVERAVTDAKAGDAQARAFLASYLVGKPSSAGGAPKPTRVLAEEAAGIDPVDAEADNLASDNFMSGLRRHLLESDAENNRVDRETKRPSRRPR